MAQYIVQENGSSLRNHKERRYILLVNNSVKTVARDWALKLERYLFPDRQLSNHRTRHIIKPL